MTIGQENRPDFSPSSQRKLQIWRLLGAALIAGFYLFGLNIPLVGPDEPRYAEVAREMYQRGDWITPALGGFHWFEKPALLYWLQIISFHLFGVSEFAARFGPAIFGLGTIAAIYFLCKAEVEMPESKSGLGFANLAALMTATSLGIIVFSRGASFDIILTFPITAAIACFYRFYRSDSTVFLAAFYVFVGVATLAKGLVGILFPFSIVFAFYLARWQRPRRKEFLSLFWGTALLVAIASTWYLPMYLRHGWEFIDEFFIQHHFRRYTTNQFFHPQPFYFFFWVLPLMTLPWLPFFFAQIYHRIRQLFGSNNKINQPAGSLERLAFIWIIIPLVFFSFSGSKLPGYILPSVPPAIVLSAFAAYRFINHRNYGIRLIIFIAAATLAVSAALLLTIVPKFADDDSVKRLINEADAAGFSDTKIVGLHQISHNAEFYAAGRLIRTADGKQKKLFGVTELAAEVNAAGGTILVLVPNEYARQVLDSPLFYSRKIAGNAEMTLIAVSSR